MSKKSRTFAPTFPAWVDKTHSKSKTGANLERAKNRLRHVCNVAACNLGPKASLSTVAQTLGYSNTSLSVAIGRGKFSQPLAEAFEANFQVPSSFLLDPLSV